MSDEQKKILEFILVIIINGMLLYTIYKLLCL